MASDDANHLRANTSARQLSTDSSGNDGGSWIYFLFLNGLNALEDLNHGPNSCVIRCEPRCHHPHLGPGCSHSGNGGNGGGDGGSGGDGGGGGCGDDCGGDSQATSDASSAVEESYSGNDNDSNEENYDDNENTTNEDQYLEYNEYNEGSGYANQINSGKSFNVWPFLIAALVVGIVAAALMAKKVSVYVAVRPLLCKMI